MHPHGDLEPRAQPVDDRHEAIDGEPRKIRIANAREVRGGNSGAIVGRAKGQMFPVKRFDCSHRHQ